MAGAIRRGQRAGFAGMVPVTSPVSQSLGASGPLQRSATPVDGAGVLSNA